MIGRLSGKIVAAEADGGLVVDVNGVGYDLMVPLGTPGRSPVDADGRTTFFVHTHVREDAFSLFGFATEFERATFRALIAISNVGPKTAVGILSALPADELAQAIGRKDVKQLTSVPGIGKKTAERLVLELADKLPKLAGPAGLATSPPAPRATAPAAKRTTVLSALTSMGYKPAEAERAVSKLGDEIEERPAAELIREALALLAK